MTTNGSGFEHGSGRVELRLRARTEDGGLTPSLADLRRSTRKWFQDNGYVQGDWLLVLTELASNAANASPDGAEVAVVFTASESDGVMMLTVVDGGPGFDPPERFEPLTAATGAPSGRGLAIVAAVTDGLEFLRSDSANTTRCWGPLLIGDRG